MLITKAVVKLTDKIKYFKMLFYKVQFIDTGLILSDFSSLHATHTNSEIMPSTGQHGTQLQAYILTVSTVYSLFSCVY